MELNTLYSVKILHYNHIFRDSVSIYRKAVDALIQIAMEEWESLRTCVTQKKRVNLMEKFCIQTKKNPSPKYDFSVRFYKFPSYLRRAAIAEALGKVSSYQSQMKNWEKLSPKVRGKKPGYPKAGMIYPALYHDNMYIRESDYTARIKVYIRNTWDWLSVQLKKSDVDYILRHCAERKECVPTLQKRGKEWYLDFSFQEEVKLHTVPVREQKILAVDLGINQACTCAQLCADGTVTGRHFLKLPVEKDCLEHAVNRIKKAQQHGNRRTPRLWKRAKGINRDIAVKTAQFIIDTARTCQADTIVFEYLDLTGKKKGSQKQKLHLWRAQEVQAMVERKAHRLGKRISHVNAWGTSRLAFDGTGRVERGSYYVNGAEKKNYSMCIFPGGKTYHCDLNAAYNIGARYFIRELIKSESETARLGIEAKVPQCARRSTCTLSSLISLYAVLTA